MTNSRPSKEESCHLKTEENKAMVTKMEMETKIAKWHLLTRRRQEVRSRPTSRDPYREHQNQRRPRGSSPKAYWWYSNSGIQVTVSTRDDRGLWFKLWSRTVVSLPLCKAREQNTRRRSTNWRILQNQALMERIKVNRWNHSPRPQWKSKERRRSQVHETNTKVLKIHRLKDSTQDKWDEKRHHDSEMKETRSSNRDTEIQASKLGIVMTRTNRWLKIRKKMEPNDRTQEKSLN